MPNVIIVLQLLTLAAIVRLSIRRSTVNQIEKEAFEALDAKIKELTVKYHDTNDALSKSQADLGAANLKIADLESQLAAVVDDSPEIVAAVNAESAKIDAELNPPAPVAPPADPAPEAPPAAADPTPAS